MTQRGTVTLSLTCSRHATAATQRLARRVGVWRHVGMTEACPCTSCMHVFMLDIQLFWSLDLMYPHLDLYSVVFNCADGAICNCDYSSMVFLFYSFVFVGLWFFLYSQFHICVFNLFHLVKLCMFWWLWFFSPCFYIWWFVYVLMVESSWNVAFFSYKLTVQLQLKTKSKKQISIIMCPPLSHNFHRLQILTQTNSLFLKLLYQVSFRLRVECQTHYVLQSCCLLADKGGYLAPFSDLFAFCFPNHLTTFLTSMEAGGSGIVGPWHLPGGASGWARLLHGPVISCWSDSYH